MSITKWSSLLLIAIPTFSYGTQSSGTSNQAKACLDFYQHQDYQNAASHCQQAALHNDANAQYVYALMFKNGKGVHRDSNQALKWFESSARAGNVRAQLHLGKMYSIGFLTAPDYIKALQYIQMAANQGNPEAQFLLALCYQNGHGVEKDYSLALYWYQQAVEHHLSEAPPIAANAIRGKERLVMKDWPGYDEYQTAHKIKHGTGEPADKEGSLIWLTVAAEKGHPQAQYELGMRYALGDNAPQNDTAALTWLKDAANKNHQGAMSYLAWMTMLGLGTKENIHQAIKWFVQARQLPLNSAQQPTSPREISDLSYNATSFESQSSSMQNIIVQFERGVELFETQTDVTDTAAGLALIEDAAKHNLEAAELYLAKAYEAGDKVKQNRTIAALWYTKAAKNGSIDAQYALGWMAYHGEGMPRNKLQAYQWFSMASRNGNNRARSAKNFVQAQLTTAELTQAQKQTTKNLAVNE